MKILKLPQVQLFLISFLQSLIYSMTIRVNENYGFLHNGETYIIGITIVCAVLYADVLSTSDVNKIILSHLSRAISRLIILSVLPVILVIQTGDFTNLYLACLAISSFYIAFELLYNIKSDKPLWYVGTVALNDRIVRWINRNSSFMMLIYPYWYIIFKLNLFSSSVILLLKYWL